MMPRGYRDYERLREQSLEAWHQRWTPTLDRHDDLLPTLALGDNFALLAKHTGLGRSKWLAEALVEADMWDRQILVLCAPILVRYWSEQLLKAGFAANRIAAVSAWQASRAGIRNEAALLEQIDAADVLVIEPVARPKTKWFAGMAKQIREAGHHTQIVTTTTLAWSSMLAPPRYADSCLKLLGYLDDPVKCCWVEDCFDRDYARAMVAS